jgi:hypothetical protein
MEPGPVPNASERLHVPADMGERPRASDWGSGKARGRLPSGVGDVWVARRHRAEDSGERPRACGTRGSHRRASLDGRWRLARHSKNAREKRELHALQTLPMPPRRWSLGRGYRPARRRAHVLNVHVPDRRRRRLDLNAARGRDRAQARVSTAAEGHSDLLHLSLGRTVMCAEHLPY